ncbi:hypothetical protein BJY00DRAFT_319609 [Aspergillus carlsbadensis]|nr:hypothetical protein BJY00DRAFT_319609 [Aspergillus carlsbadensis]
MHLSQLWLFIAAFALVAFALPTPDESPLTRPGDVRIGTVKKLPGNPEIMYVACRIRKYVVNGDAQEARRLKDAYKDTLTMEAVAAAIIAQIAITMLSLPNFASVHCKF